MPSAETQSRPNWPAILTYYVLACAWSWPFFWWRDVNTASWNAWQVPDEIKGLTQVWGPGLAALVVFYFFPGTRTRKVSFFGGSWIRSACFCLSPILFAWIGLFIQSGKFSHSIVYYLLIGGFSTLGEELGWRGFLQGALKPMGRVRAYLLLAFMWEAWHFTSHTKGTLHEVISRLAIYIPLVIVITVVIGLVNERTGSLVLAFTLHEWIDIVFDGGSGYLVRAALISLPVWAWLIWSWPRHRDKGTAPSFP
jgi:membrane protease YdiL (CAAX protease family)